MKMIDKNSKIFKDKEYLKDRYMFHLITLNLDSENVLLYSDEENYLVCRGNIGWPTWIWTKDNFPESKLPELIRVIDLYLTDDIKDKFTCKKELYEMLKDANYDKLTDDYFEMGSLYCPKIKPKSELKIKDCDGYMDKPQESEKEILTEYWYLDNKEMNGVEEITKEQAKLDVENLYNSERFYVWRNKDNKIVSMVYYSVVANEARLNHVYTPKYERGKGYAANLIYELTQKLLKENLVPLLYTDYNYIPSNKAYLNAGYENLGVLINFSCSKRLLERKI